jgi:hypothetical protein
MTKKQGIAAIKKDAEKQDAKQKKIAPTPGTK